MLGLIRLALDHDVNAICCTRRDSQSISRTRKVETMESFVVPGRSSFPEACWIVLPSPGCTVPVHGGNRLRWII